ncbi:MAG TPA: 2-dehydro-3-deoxy-6-phosphogalactonate aldolase [Cellulomonadaceae bacterium]|nr:2-dehydro-3-deoxy-6-phosphogalactonate aldolase [Cellulomonadaceae bacterium]
MTRAPEDGAPSLIAILRGVTERESADVGRCLYEAGFRALEVPLNSPDPLRSITALRAAVPHDCAVGAGTVLTIDQVRQCREAGAEMIISPNTDAEVIGETLRLGMRTFPGAATPTEAFAALSAGARDIKIFPADQVGTAGLRAWTAVLPRGTGLLPVGGVDASNMAAWCTAGATGFGIGSSLYRAGVEIDELRRRAVEILSAWAASTTTPGGTT